jgi:DNA helicase-2/ATP-dependent DNA helicase PcrA
MPRSSCDQLGGETSRTEAADSLQLAIYRIDSAELMGLPVTQVGAAFGDVRTGDVIRPDLPDRRQLITLLNG